MGAEQFDWDPRKAASNFVKHGIRFEIVSDLDWDHARAQIDNRKQYGELRLRVLVTASNGDYYVVIFTPRRGLHRIISIRRAGAKEVREWPGTRL